MLTVVSGALRSYLDYLGELPEDSMKIMVPVSVRDEKDADAAGNQVSMMITGCGSHLDKADDRLEFVMAETKRSKAMTEAIGAKTLMEVSGAMPAGLMAAGTKMMARYGMAGRMPQMANTIVTNVPGPPGKFHFAGAEAVRAYGTGILGDGVALLHTVTSYNGDVVLTFLADRDAMPDPANYAEMLQQSFDDLMEAAAARTKKK